MKWKIFILFILVFITSCEKEENEDDTILKFFSEAYEDAGYGIAIAEDGYFLCGQMTNAENKEDILWEKAGIIKAGFDGNVINKYFFEQNLTGAGNKIIVLDDGSVVCTGYVIGDVTIQRDIFVVRLGSDLTGAVGKIYKTTGNQAGTDIIETQEGFLVLGTTDVAREPLTDSTGNRAGRKDILLMRINRNLEQIAAPSAHGFPGDDTGAALKAEPGGGYIVAGTTDMGPKQSGNNILILKINTDCNATHTAILGGADDEYVADIELLDDGYLVAGTIGTESVTQSVYTLKVPPGLYGSNLTPVKIDKTSWSVNAMCRYKSNYFVLAGKEKSGSSAKMLIFVVDSEGNLVEGKEKITGSTGIQVANDVVSDNDSYIIAVGTNNYGSNSMISLFKFRF